MKILNIALTTILICYSLTTMAMNCPAADSFICEQRIDPFGSNMYDCYAESWYGGLLNSSSIIRVKSFTNAEIRADGRISCNYVMSNHLNLYTTSYLYTNAKPSSGKWINCTGNNCCYSSNPTSCQFTPQ